MAWKIKKRTAADVCDVGFRQLLHVGDGVRAGLPAHAERGVPRPEAGEPAAGPRRPPEDDRLRLRQEADRPHLDAVRHARVPGARDHPVQRTQQGRRLVGPR